ncbi:MAG: hypothetical protein U0441_05655 [Polyangiaceae bacterium]
MITNRSEACRKGLRMAAHVAALSSVLAAAAAASQAAEAKIPDPKPSEQAASGEGDGADRIGDLLRVSRGGDCGCAPCWGPPAPPPMRAELFDAFADLEGEEAAS